MSKLDTVFNQLKRDVLDDDYITSICVYVINVIEVLNYDRDLIISLWQRVVDEMTLELLESNLEVYKRLNQINSYLYFYILTTIRCD